MFWSKMKAKVGLMSMLLAQVLPRVRLCYMCLKIWSDFKKEEVFFTFRQLFSCLLTSSAVICMLKTEYMTLLKSAVCIQIENHGYLLWYFLALRLSYQFKQQCISLDSNSSWNWFVLDSKTRMHHHKRIIAIAKSKHWVLYYYLCTFE